MNKNSKLFQENLKGKSVVDKPTLGNDKFYQMLCMKKNLVTRMALKKNSQIVSRTLINLLMLNLQILIAFVTYIILWDT